MSLSRFFPGQWSLIALLGLFVCLTGSVRAVEEAQPAVKQGDAPFVILKLDDLTWRSPAWKQTVAFLEEKNIKYSVGIICEKALEGDRQPFYAWVKEHNATGLVEFWNHGYTHKEWKDENGNKVREFAGASYEEQKQHFERSQALAQEKLGLTFRTFGAPFNKTDENTLRVLNENPDVKVFLYGTADQAKELSDVMVIERTPMNIEYPLFIPNPDQMKKDYAKLAPTTECFVIQGHPNSWDKDDRFERFKELVNALIEQGVTFTTPYEYYLYCQQKEPQS